MIIKDIVYGEIEVNDPVLVDLIHSAPLQRLKNISQLGSIPNKKIPYDFSRYSHCVGAMLLLRISGASVKEQIAGLIHDAPHTAFSHVIDWVFSENIFNLESYHEKLHNEVLLKSEISEILKKHGHYPEDFMDLSKFTLLERDIPDICADRLDYTFRHFVLAGRKSEINEIISKLKARSVNGNTVFIFEDMFIAKKFAELFLSLYKDSLLSPASYVRYHFLSNAIKIALAEKILENADLMQDDKTVFSKLKASNNREILHQLSHITGNADIIHVDIGEEDLFATSPFKYVDPLVHFEGTYKRVTEILPDLKEKIEADKKTIEDGYYLKVIKK